MKFTLLIITIFFFGTSAQTFEAAPPNSKMIVAGTSTIHDWESEVQTFKVTGNISSNEVTDLKVVATVGSIKSGKDIMDDKTYEALEFKKYPEIIFTGDNFSRVGNTIKGTGSLQIAGQTKEITLSAVTETLPNGKMGIKGEVAIIMSEFGITPPTAMFGTISTGDEVFIKYNLIIQNN